MNTRWHWFFSVAALSLCFCLTFTPGAQSSDLPAPSRADHRIEPAAVDLPCLPLTGTAAGTVSADMTCLPESGTLPFTTQMAVTLTNNYTGLTRRIAGRIDVTLASGKAYTSWRAGYTNIAAGSSYATAWNQTIPALGSLLGDNVFTLRAMDVTPSPYNQPPHPPAGDTALMLCTVEGLDPQCPEAGDEAWIHDNIYHYDMPEDPDPLGRNYPSSGASMQTYGYNSFNDYDWAGSYFFLTLSRFTPEKHMRITGLQMVLAQYGPGGSMVEDLDFSVLDVPGGFEFHIFSSWDAVWVNPHSPDVAKFCFMSSDVKKVVQADQTERYGLDEAFNQRYQGAGNPLRDNFLLYFDVADSLGTYCDSTDIVLTGGHEYIISVDAVLSYNDEGGLGAVATWEPYSGTSDVQFWHTLGRDFGYIYDMDYDQNSKLAYSIIGTVEGCCTDANPCPDEPLGPIPDLSRGNGDQSRPLSGAVRIDQGKMAPHTESGPVEPGRSYPGGIMSPPGSASLLPPL